MGGMQGINPFDIAAGICIGLYLTGAALYWGRKPDQGSKVLSFCLMILTLGLVFWRVSCWSGRMVCT